MTSIYCQSMFEQCMTAQFWLAGDELRVVADTLCRYALDLLHAGRAGRVCAHYVMLLKEPEPLRGRWLH
jgi:hypothetical protein